MRSRATPFVLAVLFAAPAALGFEEPRQPAGKKAPVDPAAELAAEEAAARLAAVDTLVEVKGNRFRIKMTHGAQIEGVLAAGVRWEKLDERGEYEECKETEKGAGLRLSYVLGMEGDIHILRKDISDIRDLGALTDEETRAIRDKVIAARRKVIEQREKALREDLKRMAEEQKQADARAGDTEAKRQAKDKAAEDAEIKRGEELLKKFPPEEWSEQRMKDILQREIVNGIFRNAQEREFIDNFKAWMAADNRRRDIEGLPPVEEGKGEEKKDEPMKKPAYKKPVEKLPVENRPAEKTPPEEKKPESGS